MERAIYDMVKMSMMQRRCPRRVIDHTVEAMNKLRELFEVNFILNLSREEEPYIDDGDTEGRDASKHVDASKEERDMLNGFTNRNCSQQAIEARVTMARHNFIYLHKCQRSEAVHTLLSYAKAFDWVRTTRRWAC